MNFKIQLVIDDGQGIIKTKEIIRLEKPRGIQNQAGISLLESKKLLTALQEKIVLSQVEDYINAQNHTLNFWSSLWGAL